MSGYDCECGTSVTEFWFEETRTARKEHECGECKTIIPVGTRYSRTVGKDSDWGFWSFIMCLDCQELWNQLHNAYDEAQQELCRCFGKLEELCHEALDLDTKCYPFVQRLVKKGFLNEDDICPGSTLREEWFNLRYNDPRQVVLEFT